MDYQVEGVVRVSDDFGEGPCKQHEYEAKRCLNDINLVHHCPKDSRTTGDLDKGQHGIGTNQAWEKIS